MPTFWLAHDKLPDLAGGHGRLRLFCGNLLGTLLAGVDQTHAGFNHSCYHQRIPLFAAGCVRAWAHPGVLELARLALHRAGISCAMIWVVVEGCADVRQ